MYLDTAGKVTVGVGLMLSTQEAAQSLPFLKGAQPATAAEITRDFARVSAMKPGELAKLYREADGLQLSDEAINDRLRRVLLGFEGYLRSHLSGYDALPDAAKIALLDMSYNLGPGKLFAEYKHLIDAISRSDWKAAAIASLRHGPSAARNKWTRQQFLDAASTALATVKAEARQGAWGTILLGAISGFAAAAATAIIVGELHRLGASRRGEAR